MKPGFEEAPQSASTSGSQTARHLTEAWVSTYAFCPNCGHERLTKFANNRPVADLFCTGCNEEFELKSQKAQFGARIVDGAFRTMTERLASANNPNLMLMNYSATDEPACPSEDEAAVAGLARSGRVRISGAWELPEADLTRTGY